MVLGNMSCDEPLGLCLMGMDVRNFKDLYTLKHNISANQFENDPKEQRDGAHQRKGAGWDPVAECRLHNWEMNVRLSKCDVFEAAKYGRISTQKVAAYMLHMLPSVVAFIKAISTNNTLLTLFRLNEFMQLFFHQFNYQSVLVSHPLFHIMAAMRTERGSTWAQQLKWFFVLVRDQKTRFLIMADTHIEHDSAWVKKVEWLCAMADDERFLLRKAYQIRRAFNNRWTGDAGVCVQPKSSLSVVNTAAWEEMPGCWNVPLTCGTW